ncbi:MAG TPA: glycosyltransferase, partial [Anaerolineae bacterium]|nr:glycosyltransferase [Anaerolineae bacterium]
DSAPEVLNPEFEVSLCKTQAELQALTFQAQVIITVGANLSIYPFLRQAGKPLVVDMYIPFMLEDLQKYADRSLTDRNIFHRASRGAHTLQIRSADFIICASEKQKDFWLGWLSALGRVNPYTVHDDPTLAKLIDVVPFGLPHDAPVHRQQVVKGVYKSINPADKVILWGGGIWNWLDPYTLIKAMASISAAHPDIKLLFMGVKSPNSGSAKMEAAAKAIKLSQELGLYDRQVFFNDWAAYQERENYLLEADIGASLHLNHIETRFSFRTRFLDYIWAGLPILTTAGDIISDEVARWGLGKVVKNGDAEQVSQVLVELLTTPNLRPQYQPCFERVRASYEWETVMAPLIKFCEAPYLAADKDHLKRITLVEAGTAAWWSLPGKIWQIMRNYGPQKLIPKAKEYLQWKLQK